MGQDYTDVGISNASQWDICLLVRNASPWKKITEVEFRNASPLGMFIAVGINGFFMGQDYTDVGIRTASPWGMFIGVGINAFFMGQDYTDVGIRNAYTSVGHLLELQNASPCREKITDGAVKEYISMVQAYWC